MLEAISGYVPMGQHGSPDQYPIGRRACIVASVPLAAGTTDEEWDDTLCELPSVKELFLSYAELRDRARGGDSTIRSLLNLCCNKFGDRAIDQLKADGVCSKPGFDLGAWLRRCGWNVTETNTFKRVSKSTAAAAKSSAKGSEKGS